SHYYSTNLTIAATVISYIPASIILAILSYRFFSWYRSNKNTISLLFFIGTGVLAINLAAGAIIHSYYILSSKRPSYYIGPQYQASFPKITLKSSGIVS